MTYLGPTLTDDVLDRLRDDLRAVGSDADPADVWDVPAVVTEASRVISHRIPGADAIPELIWAEITGEACVRPWDVCPNRCGLAEPCSEHVDAVAEWLEDER